MKIVSFFMIVYSFEFNFSLFFSQNVLKSVIFIQFLFR